MNLYLVTTTDFFVTGVKLIWANSPEEAKTAADVDNMSYYYGETFKVEEIDLSNPTLNQQLASETVLEGKCHTQN